MNQPAIFSFGEVLWDLFPAGPRFGGAPANFACHAAIQGGRVTILSAVGADARGSDAIALLQRFGVDTSLIQRIAAAPTGAVGVRVDGAGKPSFVIHADSAWDRIDWTAAVESRLATADALYFGTLSQRSAISRATIQRALRVAKSRGIRRVLDINLRRPFCDAALIRASIAQCSVLKLSDDELTEVATACDLPLARTPEATLRALLERHALELVAMTRGAKGALLVAPTETVDQPGIPTVVLDTVGAGDAFTAALVVGLLRQDSLQTIARFAGETAAAVCTHAGAVPDLPNPRPPFVPPPAPAVEAVKPRPASIS